MDDANYKDRGNDSSNRLMKLRRTPDKMNALRRLLQCYFLDKKVSHLLDPHSSWYWITEEATTTTRNDDGEREQKVEKIRRPALNMEDWMSHRPKPNHQMDMERDSAVLQQSLELAMGADFFKAFHEDKEKEAKIIIRILLPYQVWYKAQTRLVSQQVRSTQHMRTKLTELKFRFGEDWLAHRTKFTSQIENIEKASTEQLLDKETIPTLVASIEGRQAADHPLNAVCNRVNELLEDTKYNAEHFPDLPTRITLDIALDLIEARIKELQSISGESSLRVTAAIAQLEEMGFAVDPPPTAFAAATFRDGGVRAGRAGCFGATPAAHLPFHGARDVCWKCGSHEHTNWRTCPATVRAATPAAAPPAMGD